MPSIARQTTTFLPKVLSVLQKKHLGKRFMTSITRIHKSAIKRNESIARERSRNKKVFYGVVKEMTLLIRNRIIQKMCTIPNTNLLNIRKETAEKAKNLQETSRNKKVFYGVVKEMTLLIRNRIIQKMCTQK
jgi:hypothetical protein